MKFSAYIIGAIAIGFVVAILGTAAGINFWPRVALTMIAILPWWFVYSTLQDRQS